MYPELFRIGNFPISTFGLMMAAGFLCAWWIASRRMQELRLDPEQAANVLLYAMLGGVFGAKLYYAADMTLQGEGPFTSHWGRAGLTWYGGLAGGALAVLAGARIHRMPLRAVAACIALAAPFGHAFGRLGCFLVGDDYGHPTDAWYGVAFPQGAPPTIVPVHPTQLYEAGLLFALGAALWFRRGRSHFVFGEYLLLTAAARFVVEVWRINPRYGGLSAAQWIAIALALLGIALWFYFRRRPDGVAFGKMKKFSPPPPSPARRRTKAKRQAAR